MLVCNVQLFKDIDIRPRQVLGSMKRVNVAGKMDPLFVALIMLLGCSFWPRCT